MSFQGLLVSALLAHGETTWTTVEFLLGKHESRAAADDVASVTDFGCFWVLVPHLEAPTVPDDRAERAKRLELSGAPVKFDASGAVVEALIHDPKIWAIATAIHSEISSYSGPTDVAAVAIDWSSIGRVLLRDITN